MSKVWIIGNFRTGAISEANILPVVHKSDKITVNIDNEDQARLKVSKLDLPNPNDWINYLRPFQTMIAAVDTSKAWNDPGAVLFAGFIKQAPGELGDTITIQAAGLREYGQYKIVTPLKTGAATDPKGATTFQGSDWQRVLIRAMDNLFSNFGVSTGPQPPDVKGTLNIAVNTGSTVYTVLNTESLRITDVLDDIRLTESNDGNEYRFIPRWSSAAKNKIVFDCFAAPNNAPQINLSNIIDVDIDNSGIVVNANKRLTFENYANRLVGVSEAGDDETNTDYRIIESGTTSDVLVDGLFNPSVSLPSATLNSQMTARLNFMKNPQNELKLTVLDASDTDWILKVGSTVNVSATAGNEVSSGFNATMRLVETVFSLSTNEISVELLPLAPRFAKLPKPGRKPGKDKPIKPKEPGNTPKPPVPTIPPYDPYDPSNWPDYGMDSDSKMPTLTTVGGIENRAGMITHGLSHDGKLLIRLCKSTGGSLPNQANLGVILSSYLDPYPDIDIWVNKIDTSGKTVSESTMEYKIPSHILEEESIKSNVSPYLLNFYTWGDNGEPNLKINTVTTMTPVNADLFLSFWTAGAYIYIHFVEIILFTNPQTIGTKVNAFTYRGQINTQSGEIENLVKTDTFGGVWSSNPDEGIFIPNFNRVIRKSDNSIDFYSPSVIRNIYGEAGMGMMGNPKTKYTPRLALTYSNLIGRSQYYNNGIRSYPSSFVVGSSRHSLRLENDVYKKRDEDFVDIPFEFINTKLFKLQERSGSFGTYGFSQIGLSAVQQQLGQAMPLDYSILKTPDEKVILAVSPYIGNFVGGGAEKPLFSERPATLYIYTGGRWTKIMGAETNPGTSQTGYVTTSFNKRIYNIGNQAYFTKITPGTGTELIWNLSNSTTLTHRITSGYQLSSTNTLQLQGTQNYLSRSGGGSVWMGTETIVHPTPITTLIADYVPNQSGTPVSPSSPSRIHLKFLSL